MTYGIGMAIASPSRESYEVLLGDHEMADMWHRLATAKTQTSVDLETLMRQLHVE